MIVIKNANCQNYESQKLTCVMYQIQVVKEYAISKDLCTITAKYTHTQLAHQIIIERKAQVDS